MCQSYGEAYRKIMRQIGIDCDVVSANSMGHEWNAVKLDGKWYEVDVTWDTYGYAPAGQGTPSSTCDHDYFALSDEVIRYDHFGHSRADCVSMDDNYYVRSGLTAAEMEKSGLLAELETEIGKGSTTFRLTYPDEYYQGQSMDALNRPDIIAAGIAALYTMEEPGKVADKLCMLTAKHVPNTASTPNQQRGAKSCAIDFQAEYMVVAGKLMLPAGLTTIDAGAFDGATFDSVTIPASCKTIGSRAFAGNSALTLVIFEGTSAEIDGTAFAGSSNVVFYAPADSELLAWAIDSGYEAYVLEK